MKVVIYNHHSLNEKTLIFKYFQQDFALYQS